VPASPETNDAVRGAGSDLVASESHNTRRRQVATAPCTRTKQAQAPISVPAPINPTKNKPLIVGLWSRCVDGQCGVSAADVAGQSLAVIRRTPSCKSRQSLTQCGKPRRRCLNGPVGFALAAAALLDCNHVSIDLQASYRPQGITYSLSGKIAKSATATPAATLLAQFSQQGPKLVGTGSVGFALQGLFVSILW
jgi:hypothetical protein